MLNESNYFLYKVETTWGTISQSRWLTNEGGFVIAATVAKRYADKVIATSARLAIRTGNDGAMKTLAGIKISSVQKYMCIITVYKGIMEKC